MVWQRIRSLLSLSPRLERDAPPLPSDESTVTSLQTIAYWRYHARLSFQTPLTYLKRDGEVRRQYPPELQPMQRSGKGCLLYTSPSPRDATLSRMPSSA